MDEKNTVDLYIDYINKKILPFIDYKKLHESYSSDMTYAKGVLNTLHEAMVQVYGDVMLDRHYGDDNGFVLIPGALCNTESGKISVALFTLDLSSSGEHWETEYLSKFGIIAQGDDERPEQAKLLNGIYVPYEYCYTAVIPCDHHVDFSKLPKELKNVLKDYHKYKMQLSPSSKKFEIVDKKPSLIKSVREAEKDVKTQNKDKTNNKKTKPEL